MPPRSDSMSKPLSSQAAPRRARAPSGLPLTSTYPRMLLTINILNTPIAYIQVSVMAFIMNKLYTYFINYYRYTVASVTHH